MRKTHPKTLAAAIKGKRIVAQTYRKTDAPADNREITGVQKRPIKSIAVLTAGETTNAKQVLSMNSV